MQVASRQLSSQGIDGIVLCSSARGTAERSWCRCRQNDSQAAVPGKRSHAKGDAAARVNLPVRWHDVRYEPGTCWQNGSEECHGHLSLVRLHSDGKGLERERGTQW